jgi:hypothetical protein
MMPQWLKEILAEPTASVPDAGRALGISRNAAYEAAAEGSIRTLRIRRSLRVPTPWLRQQLMIEPDD